MSEIDVDRALDPGLTALLDDRARTLLAALQQRFASGADDLLAARRRRQQAVDDGTLPRFEAASGTAEWRVAAPPADLRDRRVDLHPPPAPAELLAALESSAATVTLDLATALPGPDRALRAQRLLLDLAQPAATGGHAGAGQPAIIFGPRPLGRRETALRWQDRPVTAALADLSIYLRHRPTGAGAYLRLSGLDSVAEAELWAEMLGFAAGHLDLDPGRLQVTLSVDTVHAAFAAEPMLHALREFASALTFDRNACLRGFVHTFRRYPQFILPDPDELTTATHFLRCRGLHLVAVAHAHGASALAPCVPWLPAGPGADGRGDKRLAGDLERHAREGFDGSGIAHPALLAEAREIYHRFVPATHQQHRARRDVRITAADLLQVVKGKITERGLRRNLRVALLGYRAICDGAALLDVDGRRETLASIALAADQLWQWVRHETGVLDDGRIIDASLFTSMLQDVIASGDLPADELAAAAGAIESHVLERDSPGDFPLDAPLP